MKISLSWLKDFVDVPSDPRELKRTLINAGVGVESVSSVDGDCVLDLEITTNRPDCLSHYGIAREVSTACRVSLKKIELTLKESAAPAAEAASVEIRDPELCARYCGRVVRNVEVRPSPEWLVARLAAVGARSINNVADITNYVLMELGHPLHAFDLERLTRRKIVVRRARDGEMLKTLDGVERKLGPENLVIADSERAVALAGVMGGADSEITSRTTSVLLESAWFDPLSIRRTAKSQGMHTEASHRFERGADIDMVPRALDRAAALVQELAGGEILRGVIDVYPRPLRRETLNLRRTEIRRILGADVPWEDVERILRSLGFAVARRGAEAWAVTPPTFRLDVNHEVDLVEEVARHYGYDRLPSRVVAAPPRLERDLLRERELALARTLVSLGYRETITSSMVDPAEDAPFSDATPITIENPLSQEASVLRTSMLPGMLRALRWNLHRGAEDLRFFEMGKVCRRTSKGETEERRILILGLTGHRRPATIHDSVRELGLFDLKGDLEELLALFDVPDLRFEAQPREDFDAHAKSEPSARIRPRASFLAGGSELLSVFESSLSTTEPDMRDAGKHTALAEIDLDRILACSLRSKSFHPISKFPAVDRDYSLTVPSTVSYAGIASAIGQARLPELSRFLPADLFRGGSIGSSHYSLLLRVTFESLNHTLTGEEIAQASQKLLDALAPLGIRLRGQEGEAK